MKHSVESSENLTAAIGIGLTILFIVLFIWFIRSLPSPTEGNGATPNEAAQYERYQSEQLQNKNGAQEACMDQMARDVERYGEQVIDTYDCTK